MARLIWAEEAVQSVESIAEFISLDSPTYAKRFVESILETVESLAEFPEMGRVVPEYAADFIREIIKGNDRIIYSFTNDEVRILTVYHSARLL